MSTTVELQGVGKIYDSGVIALQGVDLRVPAGSFVSLVGPSGCGKSTLLRLIAGLIAPSRGHILVDGRAVRGPVADSGMVFQRPVLLPWRSVLDNILFTAEMAGLPRRAHEQRARELIQLAGLQGFERHRPHDLSGGMQQRVAICRALLLDPGLLFMDEPFAALDEITREQLRLELLRIWRASDSTLFFVTHNTAEAVLLSDLVVVLSPRPGHVSGIVPVDLPRPRDAHTLRGAPFLGLCDRVRARLGTAAPVA